MLSIICALSVLIFKDFTISAEVDYYNNDYADLVFVLLVHRHGDRTPVDSEMDLINKTEAIARIIDKYGIGELTPRGLYRGYQIGQNIRRRYSSLLSPRYNSSEIYIRSTDVSRTKMTALTAMAAVYPPTDDNWNPDINWTPVPYTTEPSSTDFLNTFANCPKYMEFMSTYKPELPHFKGLLEKWTQLTGLDFMNDPLLIYITYVAYVGQKSLGFALDDALEELLSDIEKVATVVMEAYFGNETYVPLLSGELLNEFFNASATLIDGKDAPRVRVYSAHDLNVFGMIAASKVKKEARPGVPGYGATAALELRRVKETGLYVVVIVYVPDPDKEEVLHLPIEGCDSPCELDAFRNITSKFVLNEDSRVKSCKVDHKTASLNWLH